MWDTVAVGAGICDELGIAQRVVPRPAPVGMAQRLPAGEEDAPRLKAQAPRPPPCVPAQGSLRGRDCARADRHPKPCLTSTDSDYTRLFCYDLPYSNAATAETVYLNSNRDLHTVWEKTTSTCLETGHRIPHLKNRAARLPIEAEV